MIEIMQQFYKKNRGLIENSLFVIVLAFYPLFKVNQGLDVSDTAYSLVNFQYFPSADGTWMTATYLANAIGYFLTGLPKGDTLLGMNFYSGLVVSFMAILFYYRLRQKMPAWIVFAGEMLALCLCWCPTVILYNYLTYLFMGAGVLLLHRGICAQDSGRRSVLLLCAGVCLGVNVTVRMPNVVQAAFILALWYGAWLQKRPFVRTLKDTFICLLGYLAGFGVPFLTICIKYGIHAYPEMVKEMFAMTDKATDYKPVSMLTGMFGDYAGGLFWLAFAGLCLGTLYVLYWLKKKFIPHKGWRLYQVICILTGIVLIRFYWGQGMFEFCYYNYRGIYGWAVLFLLMTAACAVSLLADKKRCMEDKVLAVIVLLQMLLTPIGSNNDLYPMINNMFLAAPFTLWVCGGWFAAAGKKEIHFPWQSMCLLFGLMVFVQSMVFHAQFVFQDGVWGEKRDTLLADVSKAAGIYTNKENAETFTDLVRYAEEEGFAGKKVILYGEIPGISYFLDMPAAISTTWPDLDSYRLERFQRDMEFVEMNMDKERPVVIVSSAVAAYKGEDGEAYAWFGVDTEVYDADEKLAILLEFLDIYGYEETFCNMRYAVYK
ncbi:MAG: hypothetical protein NC314_05880 [Roseburia sp.]|nr:hypothetical protein [Roseburia sp.]MCM1242353.1 hypothetical protein [Roseburia sp.]